MNQYQTYKQSFTMWRPETPANGCVDEMYPQQEPTHFTMSPRDMTVLLGEPNSQDDPGKTTHAWDVTDGTNWVHVYNYKHPRAFSMRGDAPDATTSFLEFIMANKHSNF